MTEPTNAAPLTVIDLMRVVMDADNETRGFALRGTTNWAAHIGKAVQNAVLAKFGTPPVVAGEPFCYVSVNKQGDITRTMKRKDKWTNIPLYATPQPTQPQAGAVPLTDEQINELDEDGAFLGNCKEIVRAIEQAHGIKGGQHG